MNKKDILKIAKKRISDKLALPVLFTIFFLVSAQLFLHFKNGPIQFFSQKKEVAHISEPQIVKGIYLTSWSAGSKTFGRLLELVKTTELNAMVIDIKTGSGDIAFEPANTALKNYASVNIQIADLDGMVKKAHDAGVYLIARVFVFQDQAVVKKHPEWAVRSAGGGIWRDYRGAAWLDPAVRGVWDYNIELAREAYSRGFDEINFDYIRFPSDGNISQIRYSFFKGKSKAKAMEEFFAYLDANLRQKGIPISADLFGLTCCNSTDVNIGQRVIDAYPHFNAVAQMMYPSHYYGGFRQYKNPAEFPYEVVKMSLNETKTRLEHYKKAHPEIPEKNFAKLRPWLQDFDMGAVYDAKKVRAQIQAVYDAGANGWLIWNAKNVYTEDAFLKE